MSLIRDTYFRFQRLVHEVAKFGVVGLLGLIVQLGLQNALYPGHHIGALTSVVIASVVATTVTFLGNKFWAFKHRKGKSAGHETVLFVLFNVIGMLIQAGAVACDTKVLHNTDRFSYNVATIIGIIIATVFRLYCYRRFVFKDHRADADGIAERLTPEPSAR